MLAIYDEIEVDWKIDVVCFASVCAPEKLVMGRCYEIINCQTRLEREYIFCYKLLLFTNL